MTTIVTRDARRRYGHREVIEARIGRAMRVLGAMPDRDLALLKARRISQPEALPDFWERYGFVDALRYVPKATRQQFGRRDIDDADQVIAWLAGVRDDRARTILICRGASIPWRKICDRLELSREHCRRLANAALDDIQMGLIDSGS